MTFINIHILVSLQEKLKLRSYTLICGQYNLTNSEQLSLRGSFVNPGLQGLLAWSATGTAEIYLVIHPVHLPINDLQCNCVFNADMRSFVCFPMFCRIRRPYSSSYILINSRFRPCSQNWMRRNTASLTPALTPVFENSWRHSNRTCGAKRSR